MRVQSHVPAHYVNTFVAGVSTGSSYCRRSGVGVRPPRSPLSGWSPLRQECADSSVHDSDFGGPSSLRGLPEADPCMTSMSFGSENESLGLNQRAALSALHR